MDALPSRLLTIDLQVDPACGLEPNTKAIFGARQLLTMGRALGWTIVHARRHTGEAPSLEDGRIDAIRPLMSERVFFRPDRSIASSGSLNALIESWRSESVYVVAFDHVALLSCLLACYEHGPRLVLVEDVVWLRALTGRASIEAFRTAALHLAAGTATVSGALARAERRLAPSANSTNSPDGAAPLDMQT